MRKIYIGIILSLLFFGVYTPFGVQAQDHIPENERELWRVLLEFDAYIRQQAYPQAYEYLSIDLQNKINMVEFMEVFYHFDLEYGKEKQLAKGRVLASEDPDTQSLELVSVRDTQVFYAFDLEKQFDGAYKISAFKFFVPQDNWARVYK